ncbi:hypothetical protein DSO57_1037322 [Entomophthora muscae]|uniref:Uncharacterized protein n=1 Tax=Entomophthora muscae TaxID=34485 RepID=A0ACC2TA08_9FUNG|nr:hypothetical protein DSO57_1037322 [Entomophthora muscae]
MYNNAEDVYYQELSQLNSSNETLGIQMVHDHLSNGHCHGKIHNAKLSLHIYRELNPIPQEKPCAAQGRQEPTRLPVGPNPGLPEMPCPNQEEQESASLPSVKTGSSISTLETLESNPDSPKANWVIQYE